MNKSDIHILYIDDEMNNLISFKAVFRIKFNVHTAISGEQAKRMLRELPQINVIITDQRMPHMTGVEFLESIIEEFPEPKRILLTGYTDVSAIVDAVNIGKIYRYLSKPWDERELELIILGAYEEYKKRMDEIEMARLLAISNEQLEFLLRQNLLS